MDTILFFPRNPVNDTLYSAKLAETAASMGFNLQTGEVDATVAQARSFIGFWKPAGCIVNNDKLPTELFRGIPSVFCHRNPKTLPPRSVLFSFDENAISQMAARELLRHNLAAYGFVPDPSDDYWSREREQCFLRAMEVNFKLKSTSVCPIAGTTKSRLQASIASWLQDLPKPAGIFAANDSTARAVANACLYARLAIPNDIVLLGADNAVAICERPQTSISSIDFETSSDIEQQIRALRDLLSNRQCKTRIVRIPPRGIVHRASTMRFVRTDREVQSAVELIRRRACDGLSASEVVSTFGCSRRMAETRFRAVTGHSILNEIRAVRLNRAKELLAADNLKASEIAARCGYRSWSSVFRLIARKSSPITARRAGR